MVSKKQGPEDLNETAFRVFRQSIGEEPKTVPTDKSPAAVERGKARANKLSASQRSEIAKKAAQKRWSH